VLLSSHDTVPTAIDGGVMTLAQIGGRIWRKAELGMAISFLKDDVRCLELRMVFRPKTFPKTLGKFKLELPLGRKFRFEEGAMIVSHGDNLSRL
jgi:hypothetical protein